MLWRVGRQNGKSSDVFGTLHVADAVYEDLTKRILTGRNDIMVERLQVMLERGNAFIAVGVLHLPGEGILALPGRQGYEISRGY